MGSLLATVLFGLLAILPLISGQQTREQPAAVDVSLQNTVSQNVTDSRSEQPLANGTMPDMQVFAKMFDNLSSMFGNTNRRPLNEGQFNGSMENGSTRSGSNASSNGLNRGPSSLGGGFGGMGDIFNAMASMFMGGGPPGRGRGHPGVAGMGRPPGRMGVGSGAAMGGMGEPGGGLAAMLGGMRSSRPGGQAGPPQNWGGSPNVGPSVISDPRSGVESPSTLGRGRPPLGGPGSGNMMNMLSGLRSGGGQGGGFANQLNSFDSMQRGRGVSNTMSGMPGQGGFMSQTASQPYGGMGNLFGQQADRQGNPMAIDGNFRQQPQQWGSQMGNMPQQFGSNTPVRSFPPVRNTGRPQGESIFPNMGRQHSNRLPHGNNGQNNMGAQNLNGMVDPTRGGMGQMWSQQRDGMGQMGGQQRGRTGQMGGPGRGGMGRGFDVNMLSGIVENIVSRITGSNLIAGPPATPKPAFCQEYDCPPFTVLSRGQNYELRRYEPMTFASADIPVEPHSKIKVYWTLAEYILQGKNTESLAMPLTVPILTKNDTTSSPKRTMYFLLPYLRQRSPPLPTHPWVKIVTVPAMEVYVRPAMGYLTENQFGEVVKKFRVDLGPTKPVLSDIAYTAVYDTMFKLRPRYNEIWLVSKFGGNEKTIATHKTSSSSTGPHKRVQNKIFTTKPESQSSPTGTPNGNILNNPKPNVNPFSSQVKLNQDPLQEFMNRHSENLQPPATNGKTEGNPIFSGSPNWQPPPNDTFQQTPSPPTQESTSLGSPFNRQTESAISPPGNPKPNRDNLRRGTFETAVDAGPRPTAPFVDNVSNTNVASSSSMPNVIAVPRQPSASNPPASSFIVRPGFNFY